jgi:hypothetical protein
MEEILYDTEFEVTEKQFHVIRNEFGGVAPHREDKETRKFYVKLWYMSYKSRIIKCLNENK